jgi:molybdopterin molybdotransferase
MKELVKVDNDNNYSKLNHSRKSKYKVSWRRYIQESDCSTKGKEIDEVDIGILASLGQANILVYSKPLIGYFSTGDELVSVTQKIKKSQVYDSNRYLLHGLLQKYPIKIKDYGVVKDNLVSVEKKLRNASNECDLLITTGGVSVGDADFVKTALDKIGKVDFWKIAVKPGRPLAFGNIKKCIFFGLPGNPVSVVVTFNLFVQAAIRKITGQEHKNELSLDAKLESEINKRKGRKEFKRGILRNRNGKFFVKTAGAQGSNILSSLKDANCYIELDEKINKIKKGGFVKVIPFSVSSEHYE